MDWNIADDFRKANHNPVLTLNGNTGKAVASAIVKPGEKVMLSAKGSGDPDGNKLAFRWFVYCEAGGFDGNTELTNSTSEEITFTMPELKKGQTLHIILEAKDSGNPTLFNYRRIILTN